LTGGRRGLLVVGDPRCHGLPVSPVSGFFVTTVLAPVLIPMLYLVAHGNPLDPFTGTADAGSKADVHRRAIRAVPSLQGANPMTSWPTVSPVAGSPMRRRAPTTSRLRANTVRKPGARAGAPA
jgi:hypothetical protein